MKTKNNTKTDEPQSHSTVGLGIDLPWEYGEDNDGWYVGPPSEQRAWAASEQDAEMIANCVNSVATARSVAIEEAIVAIEESQPPDTTPWNCVEAIRKKCRVPNVQIEGQADSGMSRSNAGIAASEEG